MEISNPGEIGLELKNHLVHFLREDQARRSMREASVGYKHGICFFFTCQFLGARLDYRFAHVLPSKAGCLGLLTVEKRMLWLECCGVNGGERSSLTLLSDSRRSSASSAVKVARVRHMFAC